MNLCNVPQDLLAKQAKIDTIANFTWILVLSAVMIGIYTLYTHIKDDKNATGNDIVALATAWILIWLACIAGIAHNLNTIVTAFGNSEYAAMIKFAAECVK